jgi:hypothetical protein
MLVFGDLGLYRAIGRFLRLRMLPLCREGMAH